MVWVNGSEKFAADPMATTDLSYSDWLSLGAHFVNLEDALGGVSRLAVGHAGAEGPAFAVLDHNEPVTYLLAKHGDKAGVLRALEALGVASDRILEHLSAASEPGSRSTSRPHIKPVADQRDVKARSHPLRVRILGILEEQPASPVELSQVLDATLGTISYHVRQLNELGLLERVRETPRGGAIEQHYRAKPRPKSGGASWNSVSVIAKQAVIGAELAQTTEVATRAAGIGGFDSDHARLERLRLSLDPKGMEQLSKAVAKLVAEAAKIQEAATKRLNRSNSSATDAALVAMLFDAVDAPEPSADRKKPTKRPRTSKKPAESVAHGQVDAA